jgi:hypothetical protein
MFWKPNQTEQRKQKESPLARKRRPRTARRKPANSNRETILLEPHATPTKQTTEGRSNREKNAIFTPPSTRRPQSSPSLQPPKSNRKPKLLETLQLQQNKHPRAALIDNFCMFSRSILTPPPRATRNGRCGQRVPANRAQIPQTRRKCENLPLNFVAIKRRPDRLFS